MDKAKEIINRIHYATLATVTKEGKPWNSPVSTIHEGFIFYWASWKENQHSKNIRDNGYVFIVIYDSTAPEGTGEGVYIKGKAEEIDDKTEIGRILKLRSKVKVSKREAEEFMGNYPRRWYKAVPEKIWLNDDGEIGGNFIDIRRQIQ